MEDVPPPPAGTGFSGIGTEASRSELDGSDLAGLDLGEKATAEDEALGSEVPLGRVDPAGRRRPARLVVYRRPVEARAVDDVELAELTRRVLTGLVADLLGLTVDDVDPDASTDP